MKRGLVWLTAVMLVSALAFDASAQRRRGHQQEEATPPEPTEPNPNIVALMNGLTWGMDKQAVTDVVKEEIKQKYWAQIQRVPDDAVAEANLRTRMERDQAQFENSCVKFEGQDTPWNVSMVDAEFTHNNQEEMCKYDRGDSTEYLFFIRGKLWKVFRALTGGRLGAGASFEDTRPPMEALFGPAEEIRDVNQYTLVVTVIGVRWVDSQTELRLMWLPIYGVCAVVLTERTTLGNLPNLRRNAAAAASDEPSGLTQSITQGSATDENSDIVQRLNGQRPDPTAPVQPVTPPAPTPNR